MTVIINYRTPEIPLKIRHSLLAIPLLSNGHSSPFFHTPLVLHLHSIRSGTAAWYVSSKDPLTTNISINANMQDLLILGLDIKFPSFLVRTIYKQ